MLTVVLLLVGSIFAESKPLEGIETPLLGGNVYAWVFTGEGLPQRVIGELPFLKHRGVGSHVQAVDNPVPVKGLGISGGSLQDSGAAQGLQNVVRNALFGPNARTTLGGITGANTLSSAGLLQRPSLGGAAPGIVVPARGSGVGVPATGGVGVVSGLRFNNAEPSVVVSFDRVQEPIGQGSSFVGVQRGIDGGISGVAGPVRGSELGVTATGGLVNALPAGNAAGLGLFGGEHGQILLPIGSRGQLIGGSPAVGGISGFVGPVRGSELSVPATSGVVSALPLNNAVSPVGLVGVGQGQIVQPGVLGSPLTGGSPVGGGLLRGLGDGIQIGESGLTGNNIGGAGNPIQARELIYYPSDPSYLYPNTFNYGNNAYTLIPYNYGGVGYPYGSYINSYQNQAVA